MTQKFYTQKKRSYVMLIAIMALFSIGAKAQTTLYAGDVAFIASQMNNNSGDTFAIVLLKNIASGTQIGFTDGCYKDALGHNVLTANKNEWYFIWQATSNLAKGTIIKFWNSLNVGINAGGTANASTGTIVKGDALSLNHNGGTDQIFAFQDTVKLDLAAYTLQVTRYLAGIHHNYINGTTSDANWDGVASATGLFQSELPDSLVNGVSAIRLDSSSVKRENAVFTSNILSLDKTVINNVANWTYSNTPVAASIPVRAVWTGSWNGTASSTVDAVIQSNTAPGTFTCKSLRIDTTYNLTVTSGNTTNIYEDLYNYGNGVGSSNGNIKFWKTGTANIYGSSAISFVGIVRAASATTVATNNLLTLNATGASTYGQIGAGGSDNGSFSGNITAKYYIGGSKEGWRSICSPLNGATLAEVDDDIPLNFGTPTSSFTNIFTFNEAGSAPHWTSPSSTAQSMDNGGFAVYIRSAILPVTLDITGTYNGTSNYVLSGLTKTGSSTDTSGWHIIRNPWPTGFLWDGSIANVQGTACYIFDRNSGTYNVFDNINDGVIPPFTAFTIKVTANNVSVTLPSSSRNVALATNYLDKTAPVDNLISLTLKNVETEITDKVNFYTDATALNTYDALDGDKKMNDATAPSIYFTTNGVKLHKDVWQDIPKEGIDLPLAVSTQKTGAHTITASLENIEFGVEVYLEDKLTKKLYDISISSCSFDINPNDAADRFVLHIRKKSGSSTGVEEAIGSEYFIGSNGTDISIGSTLTESVKVEVTDLMGRQILNTTVQTQAGQATMLPTNVAATGYYLVKLTAPSGMQVAKVYLK